MASVFLCAVVWLPFHYGSCMTYPAFACWWRASFPRWPCTLLRCNADGALPALPRPPSSSRACRPFGLAGLGVQAPDWPGERGEGFGGSFTCPFSFYLFDIFLFSFVCVFVSLLLCLLFRILFFVVVTLAVYICAVIKSRTLQICDRKCVLSHLGRYDIFKRSYTCLLLIRMCARPPENSYKCGRLWAWGGGCGKEYSVNIQC